MPFRVVRTEIARSAEEGARSRASSSAPAALDPRPPGGGRLPVRARPGRPPVRLAEAAGAPGHEPPHLPDAEEARPTRATSGARSRRSARCAAWPVIADASIEALEVVAIGGGARGVNVHLAPADLVTATGAEVVDISVPEPPAG